MNDGDHPAKRQEFTEHMGESYLWSYVLPRPGRRKDAGVPCFAGDVKNQGRLIPGRGVFFLFALEQKTDLGLRTGGMLLI